jgi:glucose-1-phosphatase
MKKKKKLSLLLITVLIFSLIGGCAPAQGDKKASCDTLSHDGYSLKQVVVLSRHNIRSPLSAKGSALDTMTPHEWFAWTSDPSELSVRGGVLENEMGQYFRKWLEDEELFPTNYMPTQEEVRIYANSKQRTIATANYFKSGLLPVSDMQVEYHAEYDTMDPVFNPQLTFVTDAYAQEATAQIMELYDDDIKGLEDNYGLLSRVIDVKNSEDWQNGNFTGFKTDDSEIILEEGKEPAVKGSLKTGCSVSDALVLQYYETDNRSASFGKNLTEPQWKQISEIKDVYGDVLFTAPLVASNVAHPLLEEIDSELENENRKFTFLCGHDSNIGSVLAALSVEDYELPGAIERSTPIGCKIVISRWQNAAGEDYVSVNLVYQTTDQLRGASVLGDDNPPGIVNLKFKGLQQNADGLYKADDFEQRLHEAIDAYDELIEEYSVQKAA